MITFNRKQNKKQSGFVGLEIMVGIAVVAMLIAATIFIINRVMDNNRGKSEVENISLINQEIQKLYAQDASYEGLNEKTLILTHSMPAAIVKGEDKFVNSWKKPLTVKPDADNSSYTITTTGVSKAQCSKIINAFRKQAKSITFEGLTNGSEPEKLTVAEITAACDNATNSSTLGFTFE